MGRSIFVDENVEKLINKLIATGQWYTGVIIGQLTHQRDYVVHIASTPDAVEDEATEENVEGGEEASSAAEQGIGSRARRMARPAKLDQFIEKWVQIHSTQVNRMLPGGLSVVGVFAVAPTAQLQASQIKLKQILFTVHKTLSKMHPAVCADPITDRILLQVDSSTRKLSCSTIDVSDGKSSLRPAEWKYQSSPSRWVRLDSMLNVDIALSVPARSERSPNLFKHMQVGLSPFSEGVKAAVCSLDGVLRDNMEPLVVGATTDNNTGNQRKGRGGGGGANRDRGNGDGSDTAIAPVNVQLFMPLTCSSSEESTDTEPSSPKSIPSSASLRVCGRLCIRAFVPVRATVEEAVQAVKCDVLRSLHTRCELLSEEDNITEENLTEFVFNPPVRYFFSSNNQCIHMCDYSFEDEKDGEIKQRINDLLNLNVEGEFECVEQRATQKESDKYNPRAVDEKLDSACAKEPLSARSSSSSYLDSLKNNDPLKVAVLTGLLAILLYFFFDWLKRTFGS